MEHVKRVARWAAYVLAALGALVVIIYLVGLSAPDSLYPGDYVAPPAPEIAARPRLFPIWLWLIPGGLGGLLGAFFGLLGVAAAAFLALTAGQRQHEREGRAIANALAAEFENAGCMALIASDVLVNGKPGTNMVGSITTEVYSANLDRLGMLDRKLGQRVVHTVHLIRMAQKLENPTAEKYRELAHGAYRTSINLEWFAGGDEPDDEKAMARAKKKVEGILADWAKPDDSEPS